MAGTPPTVAVTVNRDRYAPGAPFTAIVRAVDPDTMTETIPGGHDTLGRNDTVTISRVDPLSLVVVTGLDAAFTVAATPGGFTITGTAPASSAALAVTVADAQGNQTTATCPITVVPPMLVGVDTAITGTQQIAAVYAAHQTLYPGLRYMRAFGPPTKGIPGFGVAPIAEMPNTATPHVSFKDTPTAALLGGWLDGVTRKAFLTAHHEPEGDLTVDAYRAGWATTQAARDAHPNGHLVTTVSVLTRYAEVHKAYRWQDWACKADGTPVADWMSWDCYLDVTDRYTDPATFFAPPLAAAKALGTPWGVSELGALRLASDPTGAGRAAWITDCVTYLREAGCRFVAWWCGPGKDGRTFHLDSYVPELAAWRAAVSGQ